VAAIFPTAQLVQELETSTRETLPLAQSVQVVDLATEYFPAAQSEQAEAAERRTVPAVQAMQADEVYEATAE